MRTDAYIALGSNLGDRRAAIDAALDMLERSDGIELVRVSAIIETAPIGPVGQGHYLNAAAHLRTDRSARGLLERCLVIEREMGRDRSREQRWGPRRIDLDLLLFGGLVIDEPGLAVPHPRMHERRFVLEPLAEIAPEVMHPVLGESIKALLKQLRQGKAAGGIPRRRGGF